MKYIQLITTEKNENTSSIIKSTVKHFTLNSSSSISLFFKQFCSVFSFSGCEGISWNIMEMNSVIIKTAAEIIMLLITIIIINKIDVVININPYKMWNLNALY